MSVASRTGVAEGAYLPPGQRRIFLDVSTGCGDVQTLLQNNTKQSSDVEDNCSRCSSIPESVCITKSGWVDVDLPPWSEDDQTQFFKEVGKFPLKKLEIAFEAHVLPAEDLAVVLRATKNTLVELKLTCVLLGGDVETLCAAIRQHPTLQQVQLRQVRPDDGIGSSGAVFRFIQAIATGPKLRQIQMEEVCISGQIQERGMALLQLCQSSSLESLALGSCPHLEDRQILPMFQALKTNNTLKNIDINFRYRQLGRSGIQAIGDALVTNTAIQSLTLYSNGDILMPIAQALTTSNRTLKRLRLCTWPRATVFPDVTNAFTSMARENYMLEYLDGYVGQWMYPDLQFYLKLNRAGRYHLIKSGTETRKDWVTAIISNQDDVSVVYYFLSKNPALCQVQHNVVIPDDDDDVSERPQKRQKKAWF